MQAQLMTVTVPQSARGDELGRHNDASMCWIQDLPAGVALSIEQVSRRGGLPKIVARLSAPDADGRRVLRSAASWDELGSITLANRSVGSYAAWQWTGEGYELAGASWAYLIGAVAAILGRPGCMAGYYRFTRPERAR